MGNATTRTLERVAAAVGMLASAPIEFQTAWDVPQGGVLLALPALLAQGLLRYSPEMYHLPGGFYGIDSIFLLLATSVRKNANCAILTSAIRSFRRNYLVAATNCRFGYLKRFRLKIPILHWQKANARETALASLRYKRQSTSAEN
jgi:Transposase protein